MFRIDRRSLRIRLLAWLSGIALLVTGTTWLLHGILLEDLARDFLGERLEREARSAIEQLQQDRQSLPVVLDSASQSYQIFHHLYVLRLGGDISASDERWKDVLAPLLDEAPEAHVEVRADEQHLLVYRRHFTLNGEAGVLLVGEDFAQVEAGLAQLHWWVAGIAAGLLLLLVTLNLLAVNRGLIPLSRLRDQLGQLQAGKRERLSPDVPSELDSLVMQLNHFMDEIDARLQRSRDSSADLSHALKTPLAAVTQVLRGARPIDDERRQKLVRRLEEVHAQLDAQLRHSRIAGPHAGRMSDPHRDGTRLIELFRALYPDRRFTLRLPQASDQRVPIEAQDLSEMLGILLDNAGKWATREVTCHITLTDGLRILVEDDGPGVAEADLCRLGRRGMRLDERHPGYGLGLSILTQLVSRYSGQTRFATSPLGGLRVELTIPLRSE
ncbi:sensor histidine kinase [Bisbaumannia pacifica]|uniref:histidine kinase n=1 Tax=Bisbaumannia pacifica TaxID=77098 RepID=A0A510X5U6_9GAMM|nr:MULTISPECIES: sensor histidine kinase [Halomonas]MBH8580425.1 sensor histidine kinase [Halomonas pacifica]GEK46808.1 two-component sensor [Halomonas pacifica]GKW50514.1 two-component sensor [Halomonas sp. NCCP-2165]